MFITSVFVYDLDEYKHIQNWCMWWNGIWWI